MTKDSNAKGRTLSEKLNWLVKEERLPEVFGEMGHISTILRNWGAHDAEIDVEPEDVEVVDEFFKAIIKYLRCTHKSKKGAESNPTETE